MPSPGQPEKPESALIGARASFARRLERAGRIVALTGAALPLLLIGGLKFTAPEIEALAPLISGTPWLAWLYPVLGQSGASYALGVVELTAAVLLLASPWSARLGLAGGALAAATFFVTSTLLLAPAPLPVWDDRLGGFPALGPLGQFLIKDIALLGIALVVTGECLGRLQHGTAARRAR
jgi:uncharacterized membrane protein YkgB